jgi:succinyl-CoA synthetase alpha subunit
VPGEYAAYEAAKALEASLHVMIFSDNVSVADEVALKRRAAERGLLVMGPDCGTAMVAGKPLGFANRVRPGPVGLIGASGTGLQEVSCQIHRLGSGVSHILGVGGRDLSAQVGGLSTLAAIDLLAADPATRVLVVVSKPPAPEVARRVISHLAALERPSVVVFLGDRTRVTVPSVRVAEGLSEAAWIACSLVMEQSGHSPTGSEAAALDTAAMVARMSREQRCLQGLFCGGTLAAEALLLLREQLETVRSNLDHDDTRGLPSSGEHAILDLGDDRFTRGRPHPMIEPGLRAEWIVERGLRLVGIDYMSIAPFADTIRPHQILLGAGVIAVENLT